MHTKSNFLIHVLGCIEASQLETCKDYLDT